MSSLFDVSTISVLVASTSVAAGAIYYVFETKHQRRERQTNNVLKLSPWFGITAREFQEAIVQVCSVEYTDYEDYKTKYFGKPEHVALKLLGNYFEGIGLLVFRNLVELEIVQDFWGDLVQSIWEANEELIIGMRKDSEEPKMFEYWEYMYSEMKKKKIKK